MGSIQLTTKLEQRGPAAAVVLDDAAVATIGEGARRFPVVATINGYTWRGAVSRMRGEFLLGLTKETRAGAGVEAGEKVEVSIELDSAPRAVEVPEALAAALAADKKARKIFDGLAYTHRKEYARWVAEAKREETRERRISQAIEMLHEGRTRS